MTSVRSLIAGLIALTCLPAQAGSLALHPRVPAESITGSSWEASVARALALKSEALQDAAAVQQFLYPGQRSVYDNMAPKDVDVTRVDTEVTIDISKDNFIHVHAQITLVCVEEGLDEVSFTLDVPDILELTWAGGLPLEYKKIGSIVEIYFDPPLTMEQEVVLDFTYEGQMDCSVQFMLPTCKLDGGMRYVTHSQFLPSSYGWDDLFVGDMRILLTGKDYEEWSAGGTGTLVDAIVHPSLGTNEFVFEHSFHTSLYAFAVSKYQWIHGQAGDVPLAVVVEPKLAKHAGAMLEIMQEVLGFYGDIYVPFPWNKLDAVEMPNSFSGGFGPLGTIMMSKFAFEIAPGSGSYWGALMLVSHEMAHQWWGNYVEMADIPDIIVSEGLAEFSSNLHFEKLTGSRYGFVDNNLNYLYTVPHDEEPYIISPFVAGSPYYYQVVYNKGSQIFDMLRLEIGEEVLLAGLTEFILQFGEKFATVHDLFDVLEEVSGEDLGQFYAQWLEGKGYFTAILDGEYDAVAGIWRLEVEQAQSEEFHFTLPIYFEHPDGTFSEQKVKVDKRLAGFELAVEKPVLRVSVDPRRIQIRRFVPALPGDLDLSGRVDGEDLVEMSFAHGMNLTMGPEGGGWFHPNAYYNDLADLSGPEGPGDADGRVDYRDVKLLLENFGKSVQDL